jgi:cobalamin biosynthesis Mg chelatase CobN
MSTIGASTKARMPITKWVTPGERKAQAMSKKKTKIKKGDLFGAMMAASSSDEEEEEVNEETEGIPSKQQTTETSVEQKTTANSKKKRSKKKKGKTNSKNSNMAAGANSEEDTNRKIQASESVPMAIINVILAMLSWALSLIFGGESKKRKQK